MYHGDDSQTVSLGHVSILLDGFALFYNLKPEISKTEMGKDLECEETVSQYITGFLSTFTVTFAINSTTTFMRPETPKYWTKYRLLGTSYS